MLTPKIIPLAVCVTLSFCLFAAAGQRPKQKAIESLLGKSVNDEEVRTFVNAPSNNVQMSSFPDHTYYYTIKSKGVSLMFNGEDRLTTIFLFSEGVEGYKQFVGPIPHGLKFTDTRSSVNKKLGLPARSGGGDTIDPLGKIPIWDKYHFSTYSLHVSYGPTGTVQRLTLMERSADPDFK